MNGEISWENRTEQKFKDTKNLYKKNGGLICVLVQVCVGGGMGPPTYSLTAFSKEKI